MASLMPASSRATLSPLICQCTPNRLRAYLGIIKAGGVVIAIADSFAPDEIQMRLRIANAKGIFTQDYIHRAGRQLPLYLQGWLMPMRQKRLCFPVGTSPPIELRNGDLTWEEFLSDSDQFDAIGCDPHDHTNILFSSGTTGEPKAIPWMQTTPIKCAVDAYLHHDIQHGDVLAWPTNLGWMMGPWLIYASLINQGDDCVIRWHRNGKGIWRVCAERSRYNARCRAKYSEGLEKYGLYERT